SGLTSLDVSGFDTSKVTAMSSMFKGMSGLTSLDVSSFDTSQVTAMISMFKGMSGLTSLDVSSFDTSQVTAMVSMFKGMSGLTSLDVSGFDTSKVTAMNLMLGGMTNLRYLKVGLHLKFTPDVGLVNPTRDKYYSGYWEKLGYMGSVSAQTIMSSEPGAHIYGWERTGTWGQGKKGETPWRISRDDSDSEVLHIGVPNILTHFDNSTDSEDYWKRNAGHIKKIKFDGPVVADTSLRGLFENLSSVTDIENLNYLQTSKTTDFSGMFASMGALTNMESNSKEAQSLGSFDTSNAKYMGDMFNGLSSLTSLDVSGFDTSKVTDMGGMFNGLSSLTSLDVSGFDTSKVTDMRGMFNGLSSLTSLDVSGFDTSKVTDMMAMFHDMSSLTSLDVSGFDTSKVTDMSSMFHDLKKITDLDVSNFNTAQVTHMDKMFQGMDKLTSLDISHFDTSQVIRMEGIFYASRILSKVNLSSSFKFVGGTGTYLQSPPSSNAYTGKWINLDSPSIPARTAEELMNSYDGSKESGTYVWEKKLDVSTKESTLLLGSDSSQLSADSLIDKVEYGGKTLSKEEYSVEFLSTPDTSKTGDQEFKIRVKLNEDASIMTEISTSAHVVWGSTLVVEDNTQKAVDASVSLLDNKGIPTLNANQGFGTLNPLTTSQPTFEVFRGDTEHKILNTSVVSGSEEPKAMAKRWNESFASVDLRYGDVTMLTVDKWGGVENWHGEDTFISRNEQLVKETEGYDEAYYELTSNGYRLLHLNQFTVHNDKHVSLGTTKEEMNKNISDYITLPENVEKPENYRMEFGSVDTQSSGEKKSTLNVYEKLASGGEFLTSYEVSYVVDPAVTEDYYDTDNNLLEAGDRIDFDFGTSFNPSPSKYREIKDTLYVYKGWSEEKPGTENFSLKEGIPTSTSKEKTYYYIYEKADKLINVTLPTEIVFGTYDSTQDIASKSYSIKNNSTEVNLEMNLSNFDKVSSDIKLLDNKTPDPTQKEASARLDLVLDGKSVIPGLTEAISDTKLTSLSGGQSTTLGFSGKYFGDLSEKHKVDYNMNLKFKAEMDEKSKEK
ncbi:BspA family leucine-rich repeat surface protein, partial [Lactococcus garvieae]